MSPVRVRRGALACCSDDFFFCRLASARGGGACLRVVRWHECVETDEGTRVFASSKSIRRLQTRDSDSMLPESLGRAAINTIRLGLGLGKHNLLEASNTGTRSMIPGTREDSHSQAIHFNNASGITCMPLFGRIRPHRDSGVRFKSPPESRRGRAARAESATNFNSQLGQLERIYCASREGLHSESPAAPLCRSPARTRWWRQRRRRWRRWRLWGLAWRFRRRG